VTVLLQRHGSITVAHVNGDIDMANTASLLAAILAGIDVDDVALVLDLSAVRYLDSAGVQMLFELARHLDTGRRAFAIAIGDGSPARAVLKITQVEEVASVRASVDEAIDAVAGTTTRSPRGEKP